MVVFVVNPSAEAWWGWRLPFGDWEHSVGFGTDFEDGDTPLADEEPMDAADFAMLELHVGIGGGVTPTTFVVSVCYRGRSQRSATTKAVRCLGFATDAK